jgi:myo-inositol-1(or 4)-monophosphatase
MASRSAVINVMVRAAEKAARRLRRDFGEVEHLQVSVKGPGDFVSNADLRAEKTLREELHKARPDFGFVLEESGAEQGTDPSHRWLVDPLDGTTNFLHGIPHFAISIGLEREGDIIAGVVYDPIKEEMFWAEKGVGAYLNDRRLRVSSRRKLGESVVATGLTPRNREKDKERGEFVAQLAAALEATAGLRRFGSASLDLAYVAAGRYDAFWENELAPWDIGAGICLVREAGGFVTEINGGPNLLQTGSTLACNVHLYQSFKKLLNEAGK